MWGFNLNSKGPTQLCLYEAAVAKYVRQLVQEYQSMREDLKKCDRQQRDLSTDREQRASDLQHHASSEMCSMRYRTHKGFARKG